MGVAAALLAAFVGSAEAAQPEEKSSLEQSADKLLIGIPVAALGLTFLLDKPGEALGLDMPDLTRMNGSPRHDLGLAMARTVAVTYGLKYAVDEERPNGETGSFPSGHTAITFAGAEFMRKTYGWQYGVPAYAAATFVGWSRVETGDHWTHDVLAGATIGVLSNYDFGSWHGFTVKPGLFRPAADVAPWTRQVPEAAPGLRFSLSF